MIASINKTSRLGSEKYFFFEGQKFGLEEDRDHESTFAAANRLSQPRIDFRSRESTFVTSNRLSRPRIDFRDLESTFATSNQLSRPRINFRDLESTFATSNRLSRLRIHFHDRESTFTTANRLSQPRIADRGQEDNEVIRPPTFRRALRPVPAPFGLPSPPVTRRAAGNKHGSV
jgi:hypothetical protein